jgi:hypothetical protein
MYRFYEDCEGFKIQKKTLFGWRTLSHGMSAFGECEIKFSSLEKAKQYLEKQKF